MEICFFEAGRMTWPAATTKGKFNGCKSQEKRSDARTRRHGSHLSHGPVRIGGQRAMPDVESDRHQQRLLLLVLERQSGNGEFLPAGRWPLHVELERHQQLGGRQGLADRLTPGRELLGQLQFARQRLPDSLWVDHQSAHRVLHRRQLGHLPPAGRTGLHGHGHQRRRHVRHLPHAARQPALHHRHLRRSTSTGASGSRSEPAAPSPPATTSTRGPRSA